MADVRLLAAYRSAARRAPQKALGGIFGRGGGSYIDITLLGDKELQRKLDRLPRSVQTKLIRNVMKTQGNAILRPAIVAAVPVLTGKLKAAMAKEQFKVTPDRRQILVGIAMPPRKALDISPDDKYYYPRHVEYGHGNVPPHSYIRRPVDENASRWHEAVARTLGPKIEAEAAKL